MKHDDAGEPECICDEINARHCPVHGDAQEPPREWIISRYLYMYERAGSAPGNQLISIVEGPDADKVHVIEKRAFTEIQELLSRQQDETWEMIKERDAAITMRDEYLSRLQEKCDDVLALIEEKQDLRVENERLQLIAESYRAMLLKVCDAFEGQFGIEETHLAVKEARKALEKK